MLSQGKPLMNSLAHEQASGSPKELVRPCLKHDLMKLNNTICQTQASGKGSVNQPVYQENLM